eukprot:COSAG02_NODE_60659_length_270_cov_1.502924_1_plen_26_part_10
MPWTLHLQLALPSVLTARLQKQLDTV